MTAPGWHRRGYLPHFEGESIPQSATFRLYGTLPKALLDRWQEELQRLPKADADLERRRRVDAYLDQGHGPSWLADKRIANLVQDALLHFDGERYQLHAWVVMPNHVHALLTPCDPHRLQAIVSSWKSFTAIPANRVLERSGPFWQREYFDRAIRNENHFVAVLKYIEGNPVKAGLCASKEAWPFSSAAFPR